MRAKLLSLLILAAATTAGAAYAQTEAEGPQPPQGPAMSEIRSTGPRVAPTTPLPVFAVIGHHLVSGELRPSAPLMALVDARQPTFSCAPSQRGAEIVLTCSDGSSAQLKLDESGCGRSQSGAPASLCIGFAPKYAVRRLTAPAGEALRIDRERLVLEPVAGD